MKVLRQLVTLLRVVRKGRRHRTDLLGAMAGRPQLLAAIGAYETGVLLSARVNHRLKQLAELKVASIVACEYCLDIGAELGRRHGITEQQLRDLARYRESDAYGDDERLVIELADVLTRVPVRVPDELRARLEATFTKTERAELAATIAWENHRARLNQALGVRVSGFSDGAYCPVPET